MKLLLITFSLLIATSNARANNNQEAIPHFCEATVLTYDESVQYGFDDMPRPVKTCRIGVIGISLEEAMNKIKERAKGQKEEFSSLTTKLFRIEASVAGGNSVGEESTVAISKHDFQSAKPVTVGSACRMVSSYDVISLSDNVANLAAEYEHCSISEINPFFINYGQR